MNSDPQTTDPNAETYQVFCLKRDIEQLQARVEELEDYLLSTDNMNTFEVLNSLDIRVNELRKDRGIDDE